jgi:hypothetical protein
VLNLAVSGNLDSFAQPFMGFLFWHLTNPFWISFRKNLYQNAVLQQLRFVHKNNKIGTLRYLPELVNTIREVSQKIPENPSDHYLL